MSAIINRYKVLQDVPSSSIDKPRSLYDGLERQQTIPEMTTEYGFKSSLAHHLQSPRLESLGMPQQASSVCALMQALASALEVTAG
jgi:hypothetical protein